MRTIWFWCLIGWGLLAACEEDDSSPVVILISPENTVQKVGVGDKVLFTVEAFANSGKVEHVNISSRDSQNGLLRLLDSTVDVVRLRFDYQYIVPEIEGDSLEIKLKFEATNTWGYTSLTRCLTVRAEEDVLLKEEGSFVMYSSKSGKTDAFCLSDLRLLHTQEAEEQTLDIYDYHPDDKADDVLAREWKSGTGLKFVRTENFSYNTASGAQVKSVYRYGEKQAVISNIKGNDVIIVGNSKNALGIIRVVDVVDEQGAENDRYIFNLKRINT